MKVSWEQGTRPLIALAEPPVEPQSRIHAKPIAPVSGSELEPGILFMLIYTGFLVARSPT